MLSPSQQDLLLLGESEIDDSLNEEDEVVPITYAIASSGVDHPVYGLVRQVQNKDIVVPEFQRGFVWSLKEASRFVESLLLGFPVPSIFLSKEADSQRQLVIDGQQRLLSLRHFYDGIWPVTRKEFALRGVQRRFEGFSYKQLSDADRRRLDNSVIHAIVIKQEEPSEDSSSIYHIFERLNTSGVSLTPQEIRTAIYSGPFSELLKELNRVTAWREIYGPINKVMRDQELLLRFFALYYSADKYSRPMKGFLNSFMARHRKLDKIPQEPMSAVFRSTIEVLYAGLGNRAFRIARVLNAAVFDSVMVGVARRLETQRINDLHDLRFRYANLLENEAFRLVAERATADQEAVAKRIELATSAFRDVA